MDKQISQRLQSLDILRGFDLFMLVFFEPVLASLLRTMNLPFGQDILYHFQHESWVGFRAWDLVMPLFLFMSGVSMPFSLSKYQQMPDKSAIYKRILKRVLLLFILGAIVQGNLLDLDIHRLRLYSNTLQAIAAGYLITAVIFLNCRTMRGQIIAALVLLLLYWIPMTFFGDFTPENNFAEKVDQAVLGRFRDGVRWAEDGTWSFSPRYQYTWILSSLTFGVTVLMGAIAGAVMKNGSNRNRNALILLIAGLVCIGVSLVWHLQMPIIKKIWTCSMTLFSGGWCLLLMALFYYVIDCKGYSKGLNWLKIYGMNSITAYVLGSVINFRCVVDAVSHGLTQFMGADYYKVWLTFGNYLILFFILHLLYKRGVFLRV
jgi:predicted acyltransferase